MCSFFLPEKMCLLASLHGKISISEKKKHISNLLCHMRQDYLRTVVFLKEKSNTSVETDLIHC